MNKRADPEPQYWPLLRSGIATLIAKVGVAPQLRRGGISALASGLLARKLRLRRRACRTVPSFDRKIMRSGLGGPVEHTLAYAGTALILMTSGESGAVRAALFIGLSSYAGALEFLQRFSSGRVSSLEGFLFSVMGALVGLAAFLLLEVLLSIVKPPGDHRTAIQNNESEADTATWGLV